MRTTLKNGLAAAAMLVMTVGGASAQMVSSSNPFAVMKAMQDEGYVATLGTDNAGEPKISSKISNSNFSVYFYGCDNGSDCLSVQFSAGYTMDPPIAQSTMNAWNEAKRFGKAFVDDEGNPWIQMDVIMMNQGVSTDVFNDYLNLWRLLIEDFERQIKW